MMEKNDKFHLFILPVMSKICGFLEIDKAGLTKKNYITELYLYISCIPEPSDNNLAVQFVTK